MAELVNGVYAIISVSSSLALGIDDINNPRTIKLTESTMDSADRTQVWSVFKSDNDIVLTGESTVRDTWVLKSVFSSKIVVPTDYDSMQSGIDVILSDYDTERYDYSDASEDTDDESVVPEYDDSYDRNWLVVDTGTTYTDDDGDVYSVYNIRRMTSTYQTEENDSVNLMTVSLDVTSPESEDDDPTLVTATYDSTSDSQKWIFVPASVLSESGLYTIRSAIDPSLGLVVPFASTANSASIKIGTISTNKEHQFRIDQSGNYYRFRPHHSGKAVDIANNIPKANADVIQYAVNQSVFKSAEKQFMVIKKGTAKGAQKAYLEYSVSSNATTYTVKVTKMVFYTTFAKGLSANTKIKVRYQSAAGIINASEMKAGTFKEKKLKKGACKNKTADNFGVSVFTFAYNRGSSNVNRTIKMRMTSRPAVYLGVSSTAISANSKKKKIKVDGVTVTAGKGNLAKYNNKKFMWDGSKWVASSSSSAVEYIKDVDINITVPATSSGTVDVSDDSQLWYVETLPTKSSIEYDGTIYQKYKIRARSATSGVYYYMDIDGTTAKKDYNVRLAASSNKDTQKFIFAPTSSANDDMDEPGEIRELNFSTNTDGVNPSIITLTDLTFMSTYDAFQARYLVRTYSDKTKYTDSKWMNLVDDSTSNSGWGVPGKPTFEYMPVDSIVRIPFTKEFSLGGNSNAFSRHIIFDIRGFAINSNTGYPEHGPTKRSEVVLAQNPNLSVRSSSVYSDLSSNDIGILTISSDSLDDGCQILRGRLLGSDENPISDWVSRSSMRIFHSAVDTLYRFPNNGESIFFEYAMLATNGTYISGRVGRSFTYAQGTDPIITYSEDDSERVFVEIDSVPYAFCLYSISDIDQSRLVIAEKTTASSGKIRWVLTPPLNVSFDIYVMTSTDNASWTFNKTDGYISSHLFIWNWTSSGSTIKFDEFASVIVNIDAPPQQTRSFTTGLQFSKPMARRHPVGFSDVTIDSDLSIEGTIVDPSANYVAFGPLPNHASIEYIRKLVSLSGNNIHPVYRTPLGDWYTVGVESINLSSKEVGYTTVSITQRSVKD